MTIVEFSDDDFSLQAWLEAFAGEADAPWDLEAFAKLANEAMAKIDNGSVVLSADARREAQASFKRALDHEVKHGRAEEGELPPRIKYLMARHSLEHADYKNGVIVGAKITVRIARTLVVMAEGVLPRLMADPVARQVLQPEDRAEGDSPRADEPPPWDEGEEFSVREMDLEPIDPPPPTKPAGPVALKSHVADLENPYFRVCGHDRKHIYVYQYEKKMIASRGEADWSDGALTALAPLAWWEEHFPGKDAFSKKMAVNWLQRLAFRRGYFNADAIRGRGAWRDDGRFVFHFGDKLWVDGQMVDLGEIESSFIYQQDRRLRLPAVAALSAEEGRRVYKAFEGFSWTRPAAAILLAGWCALAPISGALRWRPHVWITGGAGAGKTTLLNLVHWLLMEREASVYVSGNSTEAGIRQTLRTDALPVLFDESEQNNDREVMRVQNILSLIRQASTESGARTLKGTAGGEAMDFIIRSMFCLGSIQVGLRQQADMERISVLTLREKRDRASEGEPASEAWQRISGHLAALRSDAELPAKMLRRALNLLPVTIQNVEVFAQAAAERFGTQRDGDQYGTLMAGAWSLVSSKLATLDDARAMIDRYDWSDYLESSETDEPDKALNDLLGCQIRAGSQDVSVYELLMRAAKRDCDLSAVTATEASAVLKRHGIKVEWDAERAVALWIANSSRGLARLMEGTPYAADLKGQLGRLPGATKSAGKRRFYGKPTHFIRIPIGQVLEDG